MKVAITGVSGHLGGLIAHHILRRSSNAVVHGICRNPDKISAEIKSNDRFEVFQTSHDDAEKLRAALKGTDIAIFATLGDGHIMEDGQKKVIEACIDEHVPRYMAGDWTLDYTPLKLGDLPAKDPMIKIAEYIKKRENEANGQFRGVNIFNGAFMEIIGRGTLVGKQRVINFWGNGDDKWDLTTYNDAANFSAAIALDPEATGLFQIRGSHSSANDMIRDYKEAFGEDIKQNHQGSLEDLYKTMHEARKQQPNNIWAWLQLFYVYYSTNGQGALRGPFSNDKYDVKTTSLLEYFKAAKQPERIGMAYDEM